MKKVRKVLALLLALVMCVGLLTFGASAEGEKFRIKETEETFSDFKAAMDAAQNGQTVELLDDAEYYVSEEQMMMKPTGMLPI